MFHVEVGAVIEAIAFIVLIGRVQDNKAWVIVFCHYTFYTLHGDAVKSYIVKVYTAYAYLWVSQFIPST